MSEKKSIICINNEMYAFDIEKIKKFCLVSDKEKAKEQEIIENLERDESLDELYTVSRINRELKSTGNPQNDTIIYDIIKMFLTTLLTNELPITATFEDMNFSTALAFNTMIQEGFLYKL